MLNKQQDKDIEGIEDLNKKLVEIMEVQMH